MHFRFSSGLVGFVVGSLVTGLLPTSLAQARDVFSAPNGQLGANLSTSASDGVRAHTEVSYFTASGAGTTLHALTLTAGAGIRLNSHFELEFGLAGQGLLGSGSVSYDHYSIGNVLVGGNFVTDFGSKLRLKVGGAFAFGPWNQGSTGLTTEGTVQAYTGTAIHVYQDAWYYYPTQLHVVVPARLEFDPIESLVLTLDAQPDIAIGLNANKSGLIFVIAPGLAYWPSDSVALGFRLPVQLNSIAPDAGQTAFEPFLRFNLDQAAFLATRFTMNLDNPAGFSFDSGKTWGWHVALGGAF